MNSVRVQSCEMWDYNIHLCVHDVLFYCSIADMGVIKLLDSLIPMECIRFTYACQMLLMVRETASDSTAKLLLPPVIIKKMWLVAEKFRCGGHCQMCSTSVVNSL